MTPPAADVITLGVFEELSEGESAVEATAFKFFHYVIEARLFLKLTDVMFDLQGLGLILI